MYSPTPYTLNVFRIENICLKIVDTLITLTSDIPFMSYNRLKFTPEELQKVGIYNSYQFINDIDPALLVLDNIVYSNLYLKQRVAILKSKVKIRLRYSKRVNKIVK